MTTQIQNISCKNKKGSWVVRRRLMSLTERLNFEERKWTNVNSASRETIPKIYNTFSKKVRPNRANVLLVASSIFVLWLSVLWLSILLRKLSRKFPFQLVLYIILWWCIETGCGNAVLRIYSNKSTMPSHELCGIADEEIVTTGNIVRFKCVNSFTLLLYYPLF